MDEWMDGSIVSPCQVSLPGVVKHEKGANKQNFDKISLTSYGNSKPSTTPLRHSTGNVNVNTW